MNNRAAPEKGKSTACALVVQSLFGDRQKAWSGVAAASGDCCTVQIRIACEPLAQALHLALQGHILDSHILLVICMQLGIFHRVQIIIELHSMVALADGLVHEGGHEVAVSRCSKLLAATRCVCCAAEPVVAQSRHEANPDTDAGCGLDHEDHQAPVGAVIVILQAPETPSVTQPRDTI